MDLLFETFSFGFFPKISLSFRDLRICLDDIPFRVLRTVLGLYKHRSLFIYRIL